MPRTQGSLRPGLMGVAGLLLVAGAGGGLAAQESAHGVLKRPAIGGHTFLSSDVIPEPFVRSFVRQSLGIAQAVDLQFPLGIIGGDTLLLLEGDLTYAVLDFEYQHAVKDWLAARGRFNLRSRLGTDGTSLLAAGVQVNTGFEFGWLIRLLQTDKTILSASAEVGKRSFTVVDIRQFVSDIIDGIANPQLTDNVPTVRGTGGLRFGWGVSRLFGLTALLEVGYGDAAQRNKDGEFLYTAAANLDFDIGAVTPVPIGVSLGYNQTSVIQQVDGDSDLRTVVLRLGYTGRPDFIIGLDIFGNALRDVSIVETVKSVGAMVTMRYYF
ncbi:MAG: hypothetical protein OEY20_06000 [Gemmatimonadota bacterium]|nr:hypothetical protein [Gemmatimonadota bacterium]